MWPWLIPNGVLLGSIAIPLLMDVWISLNKMKADQMEVHVVTFILNHDSCSGPVLQVL